MSDKIIPFVIEHAGGPSCAYPSYPTSPRNEIERIQALNDLANDLKDQHSLKKKLQRATDKARMLTNTDLAFICLVEKQGNEYTVTAVSGERTLPPTLTLAVGQTDNHETENGCAFNTGPGKNFFFSDQLHRLGIKSGITTPLLVKKNHLGFLFAGNHTPDTFTRTEQCLLSLIGNLVAAEIDRKRAEEDHLRLETVLEQAVESIMITDQNGCIQYVNPGFEIVSGYRREEVLGRNPRFLKSGHHSPEFYKTMWQTLRRGNTWRGHFINRRKDGSANELDASISPVKNDAGVITHYVSVRKDVSQETALKQQLHHAQKMEALGTLAGGIAHDFNNLLMGIQGNVSLMRMDIPAETPNHRRCTTIEKYIQKGADLTRQLLGIARGGKYQQVATDISLLVKTSLDLFGRTRKEIQIRTRFSDQACTAEVDPGQIDQVLLNLFVNAWQAMPDGGTLSVGTDIIAPDKRNPMHFGLKAERYVMISVTDTGVGMQESVMERIFDPFFTTREKNRGTGLGLASAYGIVKNHGGLIQVSSTPGKGSTFLVFLPATDKASCTRAAPHEQIARGSETILLVDDEEMVILACTEMLESLGYRVLTAMKGKTAVATLQAAPNAVDLVILDLIMPEMSGREVFEALKTIRKDIKVLLASGYAMDSQSRELLLNGADGFMQKPFSLSELSRKVKEVLLPPPPA